MRTIARIISTSVLVACAAGWLMRRFLRDLEQFRL